MSEMIQGHFSYLLTLCAQLTHDLLVIAKFLYLDVMYTFSVVATGMVLFFLLLTVWRSAIS